MKGFLPDETRISQVQLRIRSLDRALEFYSRVIGLNTPNRPNSQASLSASPQGPELLVLTEDRNAVPRAQRSTGLYHVALRYASRETLAHALERLIKAHYPVDGASDHGVSEAIYLSDPDGNGIELYADRPRSQWRWQNGQVAMVTTPLDLKNLLASVNRKPTPPIPSAQVDVGHIHLNVAELGVAERFYSEFVGFAVTQRSYPGALFFAAGGYHHHIGANIWAGTAAPPGNSVGLISYRLEVPVAEVLYCLSHRAPLLGYETRMHEDGSSILQIRDPNGAWLEVQPSKNPVLAGPGSPWAGCPEEIDRSRHLQTQEKL
jgi:catechol 2,3-dioxygenase